MNTVAADALRPEHIAAAGFLGTDPRPLAEILAADRAAVRRLGLSHRRIAERMKQFRDAGRKALGEWADVPPDWQTRTDTARGGLPCPLADGGLFPKTSVTVRNLRLGTEIAYSDLSIHLIEAHGFYQGRGSPFRIEPEEAAAVLGLRARRETRRRPA